MKKISILFIALFVGTFFLSAQTFQPKQFDSSYRGLVYNKEFTIDARLHTHGFAFAANVAKIKSYYKSTYYQFEIGELKHPKEYRQNSDSQILNQGSPQSFILGKRNNLYTLRAGLGVKRYYSEKAKKKGVAIGINYEGGVTLGLLKPYYLEIRQNDPIGSLPTRAVKFSPEAPCSFLDPGHIYGSAGFFKGLGEMNVLPGIHGKIGVHFDWGAFDEFIKAIEAGIMIDVFYKRAPMLIHIDQDMADIMNLSCPHLSPVEVESNPNRPFFLNLYVNLHLGKRW